MQGTVDKTLMESKQMINLDLTSDLLIEKHVTRILWFLLLKKIPKYSLLLSGLTFWEQIRFM